MATAVTSRSQEASLAEPGLIKALFVHMKWERLSLVNASWCRRVRCSWPRSSWGWRRCG
jgi:hypothetical protein